MCKNYSLNKLFFVLLNVQVFYRDLFQYCQIYYSQLQHQKVGCMYCQYKKLKSNQKTVKRQNKYRWKKQTIDNKWPQT